MADIDAIRGMADIIVRAYKRSFPKLDAVTFYDEEDLKDMSVFAINDVREIFKARLNECDLDVIFDKDYSDGIGDLTVGGAAVLDAWLSQLKAQAEKTMEAIDKNPDNPEGLMPLLPEGSTKQ